MPEAGEDNLRDLPRTCRRGLRPGRSGTGKPLRQFQGLQTGNRILGPSRASRSRRRNPGRGDLAGRSWANWPSTPENEHQSEKPCSTCSSMMENLPIPSPSWKAISKRPGSRSSRRPSPTLISSTPTRSGRRPPISRNGPDSAGNTIPGFPRGRKPSGRGMDGRSSWTTTSMPNWPGRGIPDTGSLVGPVTPYVTSGGTPGTRRPSRPDGTSVTCPSGREC